jgi:serine/threonine-protein kinase
MEGSIDGRESPGELGDTTAVMEGSPCLPPSIGGYPIIGWLGQGGMATVLHGRDPATGRDVAIKILKPAHRSDAEIVARFSAEARALQAVRHEHIVQVLEHGVTDDGVVYQVMEKLEGETLAERMRRDGRWPLGRILNVSRQLAEGLSAAHQAGVVHRDLKPENVFLVRGAEGEEPTDGALQVKLLDFGLAKQLPTPGVRPPVALTRVGYTIGTPLYMSPEQCVGRLDVDERADIYALGVLVYELCTGKPPFAAPSAFEVLAQQVTAPFPSILLSRPDLPLALDDWLQKATQKDREARFPSMEAVREALDEVAVVAREFPGDRPLDITDPGPQRELLPEVRTSLPGGPPIDAATLVPWQLRITDPTLGPFADVITDRLSRAEILRAVETADAMAASQQDIPTPTMPALKAALADARVFNSAFADAPVMATLHDASLELEAARALANEVTHIVKPAETPPPARPCALEPTERVFLPRQRLFRVLLIASGLAALGAALVGAC